MNERILIADDEIDIVRLLCDYFSMQGYRVESALNGEEAMRKAATQPDLILLDVNMPGLDGFQVCERIRAFVSCPILFLTARMEDADKIKGFGAGGDDYIVKPFSMDELGARVEAHLRRERRTRQSPKIRFGQDIAIDYTERRVYYKGEPLLFAKKEFDILELLSQNAGQIFDRERIYEAVWGIDSMGDNAVVAEHIRRIRSKLARAGAPCLVETVWGVGYKWKKEIR